MQELDIAEARNPSHLLIAVVVQHITFIPVSTCVVFSCRLLHRFNTGTECAASVTAACGNAIELCEV